MASIFALLGVTVSAPVHSTLSRRAATLPSVSLRRMAEGKARRARPPKLAQITSAVDASSGMIVAQTLTEKEIGDPSQVGPLLD